MEANTLMALNNHLFEQMERLSDEEADLDQEIKRATSMTQVSAKIIENARLSLDAEKLRMEYGDRGVVNLPKMIE